MKIVFIKETFHSDKKNKDYYVVRYALVDDKKNVLVKSDPILWLTKETYESLNI